MNPLDETGLNGTLPKGKKIIRPIRSEEVQEMISRKPTFSERLALPIFLLILLTVLGGTWFIRYPDIFHAAAVLTAANAPKQIVIRQEGKLIRLFAHNGDFVYKGQMLAWMESTGDHKEIIALDKMIDSSYSLLLTKDYEKTSGLFKTRFHNLGELQPSYQQFVTAWQKFDDYLANGYYYRRRNNLLLSAEYLQKIHKTLENEMSLEKQAVQLSQETFDSSNSLFDYKIISAQDLRDQNSKLIDKRLSIPQIESSILSNESQQTDEQKDINELQHDLSQQELLFQQALQTLESSTKDWIFKYIIKSPSGGKISFTIPLQENQFFQMDKIIGYVDPPDSRYYAVVNLAQGNFGKIDVGQEVQLRFEAYPSEEFGFVSGKLSYISDVPSDSGFLANIDLPKGLLTNYGRSIQYKSGLKSQASIITKDQRLLERFYRMVLKDIHH